MRTCGRIDNGGDVSIYQRRCIRFYTTSVEYYPCTYLYNITLCGDDKTREGRRTVRRRKGCRQRPSSGRYCGHNICGEYSQTFSLHTCTRVQHIHTNTRGLGTGLTNGTFERPPPETVFPVRFFTVLFSVETAVTGHRRPFSTLKNITRSRAPSPTSYRLWTVFFSPALFLSHDYTFLSRYIYNNLSYAGDFFFFLF